MSLFQAQIPKENVPDEQKWACAGPPCAAAPGTEMSCLAKPSPAFGSLLGTVRAAVGVEMEGK